MKHHCALNISTDGAFRVDIPTYCKDLQLKEMPPNSGEGIYTIDPHEVFNPVWLDYVNSVLPSQIVSAFVFKRIRSRTSIHRDFNPPHRMFLYALNFLICPQQSKMMWYNLAGQLIDETLIPADRLLLVNTAQWHDADSQGVERWCVSLRTKDCIYDPDNPMNWEQILKNYKHLSF